MLYTYCCGALYSIIILSYLNTLLCSGVGRFTLNFSVELSSGEVDHTHQAKHDKEKSKDLSHWIVRMCLLGWFDRLLASDISSGARRVFIRKTTGGFPFLTPIYSRGSRIDSVLCPRHPRQNNIVSFPHHFCPVRLVFQRSIAEALNWL